MEILIDTNVFMASFSMKIDVFEELRKIGYNDFITLDLVVEELKDLKEGSLRESKAARLALELIEKSRVRIIETRGHNADDEILDYAGKNRISVATADRKLAVRLKRSGCRVVTLRQKRYFQA
jgi:rRNA-processing protein FCF1